MSGPTAPKWQMLYSCHNNMTNRDCDILQIDTFDSEIRQDNEKNTICNQYQERYNEVIYFTFR